jgi:hypothetical protein
MLASRPGGALYVGVTIAKENDAWRDLYEGIAQP